MKQTKLFLTAKFGKRSKWVLLVLGIGIFGFLSFTYNNLIDPDPIDADGDIIITEGELTDSENQAEYKYYLENTSLADIKRNEAMVQCPGGVRAGVDPGPTLFLPKHKTSGISVQTLTGFCPPQSSPCEFYGEITFMTQPNQTMDYRILFNGNIVNFNNVSGMESFIFGQVGNPFTLNCGNFRSIVLQGKQANGNWRTIRVFRFVCVACRIDPDITGM